MNKANLEPNFVYCGDGKHEIVWVPITPERAKLFKEAEQKKDDWKNKAKTNVVPKKKWVDYKKK